MFGYLIKRLITTIPVVLMVMVCVFAFVHMLPGDPARLVAGPEATSEDVDAVRRSLGLDRPLPEQFVHYVSRVAQGDFGMSLKTRRTVAEEIGARLMPTVWLTVFAMLWATVIGLLIGVISAVKRGRWQDYTGMIVAVSGISFPPFWLGLLLISLFSVHLGWLPTGGYGTWQHFVMPSFTLGVGVAAVMARFTRSAFIEIAREDYVRTARAKGVPERRVIWKHSLRNALIPIITMVGLQFGFLLGGSIVVESVFSWPGVGRLLVDSVNYRDYPVIQALILLFSLQFIFINLLVDVLYVFANPEIRYK
ncbi:glutathione ABC transporter permease GsiC [Falsirhodobacter deserti]|uniref:glutathione ABC transporter permease GsiC n=1 Tax=Falsirhodobacter deserti TaxID=1365611 RepID=UPI000FE440CC|nr:glutathione ABC transporter permease GsiC [Falsirhodobacter deserti]